jgi:predicted transposase/invertase (TIGR01784 family)
VPVSINTLENVLFMDLYNDISFEIGGKLIILIEHQSTINPNMALRLLLYIAHVLEKTVKRKSLYSGKRLTIPYPEFYVLYNGQKPYPDEEILRLSDLFAKPQELGLPEKAYPLLELEVKVININEGRNEAILNHCKTLSEYSRFIAKSYEYLKEIGDRKKAVEETVKYCLKHDIIREFLETHASEVSNMLITEWNMEEAREVWQEEAREEGLEQGLEKGREQEKTEIAKNLLDMQLPIEQVQKATGLPMEVIQKL